MSALKDSHKVSPSPHLPPPPRLSAYQNQVYQAWPTLHVCKAVHVEEAERAGNSDQIQLYGQPFT